VVPTKLDKTTWLASLLSRLYAIAQVSSFEHCLSLNEVDYFCCWWNETLSQLSYVFYASENVYILLKINSEPFEAF
jgi:hypothetical protein